LKRLSPAAGQRKVVWKAIVDDSRVAFREAILVGELCYVGAVARASGAIRLIYAPVLEKYDHKIIEVGAASAGPECLRW